MTTIDEIIASIEAMKPTDAGFPPLVPLVTSSNLPAFPVELLSPWMADYAREVAASVRF